ncbi:uncharacterized protein TNCV_3718711 [Trichonephila clavipes]|nr:uncharacterized protein TNCV_3718711 [Trichonephila clavipes]
MSININRKRSEFKPRTITCRNKRGELVSEPHEVTKVWKDNFQDLLEGRDEPIVLQNVHTEQDIIADEENPPPSITEVTLSIKKLKNNRSTGPDSIPSDLLKVNEPEFVNALHKIMVKIWETEKIPIEWEEGSVCPIFKKETNLNVVTIGELLFLTRHIKYSPTCCLQDFSLILTNETWTLNLKTIRTLETFERKALRTIFGSVKDQGCWRTRYNFELYWLYKEPQVTQVIRSNKLRWLGHIWRSPENS